jgi:hypothetical protein
MPDQRDDRVVRARFALRTPPGFWVVCALLSALACGLPREGLVIESRPVRVRIHFASFRRGDLLTVRSGHAKRVLSTLTSPVPDLAHRLVLSLMSEEDALALERVLGRNEPEVPDELNRRLDEELARFDDY